MKQRPTTTLFMIMSLDGKISTGSTDIMDFDKNLAKVKGLREGYWQYKALEQKTDIVSLNTGRVMEKIGVNTRKDKPKKIPCTFVIIDNKPHLNKQGLKYLTEWTKGVILVTTSKKLQQLAKSFETITVLYYKNSVDLKNLFTKLKADFNINKVTIQSGGTLNASLIREGLIDRISLVIAPILIGGKDTASLMDGESLKTIQGLKKIRSLELQKVRKIDNSFLHLIYKVL